MADDAHSTPTPAEQALADIEAAVNDQRELVKSSFPAVYAVLAEGDCMEPEYFGGEPIIVSSTAKCEAGDVVIIHLKPEFVPTGGYEALVKRLKYPLYGMTFPWDPTGSDVIIPITAEQINPPRIYHIPADRIRAVHKVLGAGWHNANGGVEGRRSMVDAV